MNEDGLDTAYNNPNGVHVEGNTRIIVGIGDLHDGRDWVRLPLATFDTSKTNKPNQH